MRRTPLSMLLALAGLMLGMAPTAWAGAPLVLNGSFELGTAGDADDWTKTGNVGRSADEGASDGAFAIIYNGGQTTPDGVVRQTVSTTPGVVYEIGFDFGAFSLVNADPQSLNVQVLGAGTRLDRTVTRTAAASTTFLGFTFQFQADSATSELVFTDVSTVTENLDGALDNVTLEVATSPVRSVSWATVGDPLALGEPEADAATAFAGAPLAFSAFTDRLFYGELEAALLAAGVSAPQLDDADFIAFDLNGTTGGVEGAHWSFDDGQGGTLTTSHSFGGGGTGILVNGDLDPADYEALFGVTLPPTSLFVGFILFDLSGQGLDPFAPGLTVTVEGLDMMVINEPDFSGLGVMYPAGSTCGNGVVDVEEQCDDGNTVPGDGCSALCQIEGAGVCGDGVVDVGEQCDDGNTVPGDGCSALCQIEGAGVCGDGVVDVEEQCDDGNTVPGDGCNEFCQEEGVGGDVCAAAPVTGCLTAASASVSIVEKKAGKEKWKAKLKGFDGATAQSDFGDPVSDTTRYDVCLYGGSGQLVGELSVDRAGQTCGTKPCWKAKGDKGYSYKDKEMSADGVKSVKGASGPIGKGKLQVQAGNQASKGQTALPTGSAAALLNATSATLQVLPSDATCFEALLGTVKKADGVQFKAKAP